jgi:hypothetical protein
MDDLAIVPQATLTETDNLSGEDVIPGFTCPVTQLFRGISGT